MNINWISEEALKASVVVDDGCYQCVTFCQPCRYKVNEKLDSPLFLVRSFGFFLEKKNSPLSIKKHKGKDDFYHDIIGMIDVEKKL